MTRPGPIVLAGVLLAAGPALAGEPATAPAKDPAAPALDASRAAALERLVRQDCGACHGMTLKGGLGPALTGDRLAGTDPDALAATILDGVPGTPMPPWRPLISEGDARWIAAYLLGAE